MWPKAIGDFRVFWCTRCFSYVIFKRWRTEDGWAAARLFSKLRGTNTICCCWSKYNSIPEWRETYIYNIRNKRFNKELETAIFEISGEFAKLKMEEEKQLQIIRNYEIISKTKFSRSGVNFVRRDFAIYRLYRYLDVSPGFISAKSGLSYDTVVASIGRVFANICVADDECPFKEILMESLRKL